MSRVKRSILLEYYYKASSKDLRWKFIKENKKVRKKERKHALDQENYQEKRKFLD